MRVMYLSRKLSSTPLSMARSSERISDTARSSLLLFSQVSTARRSCARSSLPTSSSRAGENCTRSSATVILCVSGSKSSKRSISSPKSSILKGFASLDVLPSTSRYFADEGNTSIIPPRTANCPAPSTSSVLTYPMLQRRAANSAGSMTVLSNSTTVIEFISLSDGIVYPSAASGVVTTASKLPSSTPESTRSLSCSYS